MSNKTDKDIMFRRAEEKDLVLIHQVYKKAIKALELKGIYQWDSIYPSEGDIWNDILSSQMFVGEVDGKIAAAFTINQDYDPEYQEGNWQFKDASYFVIHRLCVNPEVQGYGIGKKTVLFIEDMLSAKGIETIRLDAFSQNPISVKLYEGLGFKKAGEVHWRKGLFYLYEKKLEKTI